MLKTVQEAAADKICEHLVKIIKLLEASNKLSEKMLRTFEKYDAEVFESEEIARDLQNNTRPQKGSLGSNKSVFGKSRSSK